MAVSGEQFPIAAGEHAAVVTEVGASLRTYTVGGADVTFPYGEDEMAPRGCGAVLVPWPNRIRNGRYSFDGAQYQLALTEPANGNAIHGLGRWARWVPVRHEPSSVTLGLDIVPQTGWPFQVRAEVTYSLHPDSGLSVTATAVNTGPWRAPFGAGFHPYLSLRGEALGDARLTVPGRQYLVTDDKQVPVGVRDVAGSSYDLRRPTTLKRLRLDEGYTALERGSDGRAVAEVSTRRGGARVWCDETFGHLQVFTADLLTRSTAAVAIEPMTCPADAFNSGTGLVVLDPGARWRGSWGIEPV